MPQLRLPDVTLCAVSSVNLAATISSLEHCLNLAEFGACLLLSDTTPPTRVAGITHVPIAPLRSGADYSMFMLGELHRHIATTHVLIVQWDGFILDPRAWDAHFLDYDYIGATWPQFAADGRTVGNGGFSLRSKRLLAACLDPDFVPAHPEDVCICRTNAELLERRHKLRFAPPELAARFSFERAAPTAPCFGFHGVFNLPATIGPDRFWQAYASLDEHSTIWVDFWSLTRAVLRGPHGLRRAARMLFDRIARRFR